MRSARACFFTRPRLRAITLRVFGYIVAICDQRVRAPAGLASSPWRLLPTVLIGYPGGQACSASTTLAGAGGNGGRFMSRLGENRFHISHNICRAACLAAASGSRSCAAPTNDQENPSALGHLDVDRLPNVGNTSFLDEPLHECVRIKPETLVSSNHVALMFEIPERDCCRDSEHSFVQVLTVLPECAHTPTCA